MAKDIEPKLKLISTFLKLEKLQKFVIPEYQRGYSWEISQCDKLWQDIETFIDTDANDPYFLGTIIVDCSEKENNKFSLIDGQQRTTTFLLLLKALLIKLKEVLAKFKRSSESEALEESLIDHRNRIIGILYKADVEDRIAIQNNWEKVKEISIIENLSINELLIYKEEVKKIINAIDFSTAEHSVYKIPKKQKFNKYTKYFRNFKYFYDKLSDKNESELNTFAKVFLYKCQVIEIRSWQIEQAITMFNSLNSTGMPLSDADIIAAQLYSNSGENKDLFNEQWKNINNLTNELRMRNVIDIDSILQQYMYINRAIKKEYVNLKENGQEWIDVATPGLRRYYTELKKELLQEPLILCKNLNRIINIWNKIKDIPIVKLLLRFNENAKLFLASYLYRFEENEINDEIVFEVCECFLKLFTILELSDSGYSSAKFKSFLFSENIKLVDKNISIDVIKNDFKEHINKNWNRDLITESICQYEKNILVFLNEYLYSYSKNKAFDFSENVNIEHIMPASGHNSLMIREDAGIIDKDEFNLIVNKIGNKILLEENINKSIGSDWFRTKKHNSISDKSGYKDSKYSIAFKLTNYYKDSWTKEDIDLATKKSSERIVDFIFDR